ncbi:IclR family transcriptional regulator [Herbidospora yilanensis]|uniref:IclR family transcriptional regulator n=1 Tax=Herbidospora yilanensis TaxID=354426 RepID=UPI0007805CD5|nr:IclR family transcriptional regulator [Herbidospora yilanensis]
MRAEENRTDTANGDLPADDGQTSSGVDRALQVIFAVAAAKEPDIGVSELARSLGLSKAVVHRVVRTLVAADFFSVDERTRRYRLGPGAVSVGLAAMAQMEVPRIAQPYLERLVAHTKETATLSVRYGTQRMYLTQVLSPQEIRMSVQLGRLYPLHAGGSSKAILAAMEPEEIRGYLASQPLEALTAITIQDPARLADELETIRQRGYAVSLGERQQGAASVAAPVHEATGRVYGSISVCGPVSRLSVGNVEEYGRLVHEAATEVSRQLGYRPA